MKKNAVFQKHYIGSFKNNYEDKVFLCPNNVAITWTGEPNVNKELISNYMNISMGINFTEFTFFATPKTLNFQNRVNSVKVRLIF